MSDLWEEKRGVSIGIDDLPEFILEYIFTMISQYDDLDSVRLVSRRWLRIVHNTVLLMRRSFERCDQRCYETDLHTGPFLAERCSHSSCYHARRKVMFVFGGCTSTYTAFNDLWTFDLTWHTWSRVVVSRAPFPSPKALATLLPYGDNLLLYGGFSKSSPNPIHQTSTFYNELHLYSADKNQWIEIITENSAPKLASHSASIVGDSMIVFGGSMGNCSSNEIWVLDIPGRVWLQPQIADGRRPSARYGHSQVLLDSNHLLIVGGCGGPNMIYSDAWLLCFDVSMSTVWEWHEVKILNPESSAPQLWCHAACRVGKNLVALSRTLKKPKSCSDFRDMSIGTPPTPLNVRSALLTERRVAETVALRSGTMNLSNNNRSSTTNESSSNLQPSTSSSRRRNLITSKSLDEHFEVDDREGDDAMRRSNDGDSNKLSVAGSGVASKNTELQRARSIPAIIVGEIPKLVVTSSEATASTANRQSPPSERCSVPSTPFTNTSQSTDDSSRYGSHNTNNGFLARRLMSAYVLDLSRVLSERTARWQEQKLELNAPEDTILYSICVGRGEIIMFGGMRSDSAMEGLSPFTHSINNNTFVLKPTYSV
ncbi:unnamed protein product [Anisakis simplex]|uniref:F-box only protein 42 (inferred by orthology to a human protein) n=1 Tax=Anisakis simplex TaxID=6269 RepID=A0A0M3JWI4_ANISI|nr:unnamed protein product [Anisakis simplex]